LPLGANFQKTHILSPERPAALASDELRKSTPASTRVLLSEHMSVVQSNKLYSQQTVTHQYNPVTKHGTVIYGHKNELGCAMAQVVAASLSGWRLQSSPIHVGMKSTKWQQDRFYSEYYFFPLSVSFYKRSTLLFHPVSIILQMLHTSVPPVSIILQTLPTSVPPCQYHSTNAPHFCSPISIILQTARTRYFTYQLHNTLFVTDSIAT
jgi:hypothetical protein